MTKPLFHPHRRHHRFIRNLLKTATLAGALFASVAQADDRPAYDVNKPGWYNSEIIQVFAQIPQPGADLQPDDRRGNDNTVYLVGHIFEPAPFGREQTFELFPGFGIPYVTIPAHDDVFTRRNPASYLTESYGHWVVPGPRAELEGEDQNVKVRPMPQYSIAGAPLAYSVKVRGRWLLLTSRKAVRRGINAGLLKTVASGPNNGFGGIGWIEDATKR